MNARPVPSGTYKWLVPVRVNGRTHLVVSPWMKSGATLCGTSFPSFGAGKGVRVSTPTTCNACQVASCRGDYRDDYGRAGTLT